MLQNKLNHFTFKNTAHYLDKTRRYARWSAIDYFEKTPKVTIFHLMVKPSFRFLKHYFIQGGILDGKQGLIISAIMAWGVFLRYVEIIEMRQKKIINNIRIMTNKWKWEDSGGFDPQQMVEENRRGEPSLEELMEEFGRSQEWARGNFIVTGPDIAEGLMSSMTGMTYQI